MNIWLTTAGGLSVLIGFIHIFGGGPTVAKPLLDAKDIEPTAKYVNYYCWHLVTIGIFLMALLLLWPGAFNGSQDLAIVGSIMAGLYTIWGLALPKMVGQSYLQMPQGWFFLPVALLSVVGIMI